MEISAYLLTAAAALVLVVPAAAQQAPDGRALRRRDLWAQDYTDRVADPAVRFGRLANGMRYAIQRNDTPRGAVSMRMLIRSGSLSERDEERGLAHYLEHIAFRGSTNVADGETVRILERLGLRFGADTNAGTDFAYTSYQFDFPKADGASIDNGLMLFREIGGRLKIDPAAVDAERGVILSEERLRASGALNSFEAKYALTLAGTRLPERIPIGTVEIIKAATAARIRRFYEANYRPENATVVVVGDVDPAAIEAQLKKRFGDWHGTGPADPHVSSPPHLGRATARTYVGPGAIDQVSLTWTRPLDPRADTETRETEEFERLLALVVLNLRLRERAQEPDAPFSVAGAAAEEVSGVAEQTSISVIPAPGKWRQAIGVAVAEQRKLASDGIAAPDIARVLSIVRPRLQAAADAASTRTDAAIANGLINAANTDSVYTSPAQNLQTFNRLVLNATPAMLTGAYRQAFSGTGPLAFRSATDSRSGDDAALAATMAQAYAAPLAASTATADVVWPYASFGPSGRVVERGVIDTSGVTIVRFANGTRLAVKPTSYVAGGASVRVSFGDGIVGIRPEQARGEWLLAFGAPAWAQGGTTKLPFSQLQRTLEGHNVALALTARDTDFVMSGETRKAELPFQTQLLAAYYSDAAYRSDAVVRVKGMVLAQLAAIDSNPLAVMSRAMGPLTHNGDPRWKAIPDATDVAGATGADLPPLLRQATLTPADVVVVGDVTVDDAIATVASTFGALPPAPRPRPAPYTGRVAPLAPNGTPLVVTHGGRADQAIVVQLWPTTDYFAAPADAHALEVARALLFDRLIDTVREKLGLTYSPFVSSVSDLDLRGNGYFFAGIEVPAAKFDQFRQVLTEELTALATKAIAPDALSRAKTPIIAAQSKARETNGYWAARILRTLRDPRSIVFFQDEITGIESVSAADVQRVLATYVIGKRPLSIEVVSKIM